jgi:hypothetical protein
VPFKSRSPNAALKRRSTRVRYAGLKSGASTGTAEAVPFHPHTFSNFTRKPLNSGV